MLHKLKSVGLSLIALLTLGIQSADGIEVSISPPRFEIPIGAKKRSQSLKIKNFDDKPVQMKANIRSWILDENSKLQEIESTEQTLDQAIIFTPSRFTIPPGGEQTIRFAIRPKVKLAPGEHRAIINLEEIPRQDKNRNPNSLITVASMGVVIYAYSGEIKRVGVLNSVNIDTKSNGLTTAAFDISSQGNAHVRMNGQYAIWKAAKYPGSEATKNIPGLDKPKIKLPANVLAAGKIKIKPVLPANRRQQILPIAKKLPPGKYILDINADLSGTLIDKGIPFTVPPLSNNSRSVNKKF